MSTRSETQAKDLSRNPNLSMRKNHNTCCYKYYIEFDYYYHTYIHIYHGFNTNHVKECLTILPPISLRDSIQRIMCLRSNGQSYYAKSCLDATCPRRGGFSLLSTNLGGWWLTSKASTMSLMILIVGKKEK